MRAPEGAKGANKGVQGGTRRYAQNAKTDKFMAGENSLNDGNNAKTVPNNGGNKNNLPGGNGNVNGTLKPGPQINPTGGARTPFGQQMANIYTPGGGADLLRNNPGAAVNEWYRFNNIDPMMSGGLYKVQSDLADRLGALFDLVGGQDATDNGAFLDFLGQMLTQYATPGGKEYSANDFARAFAGNFQPGGDLTGFGSIIASPSLSPEQQVRNTQSYLSAALSGTMSPAMMSGIMNQADYLGDQFIGNAARGQSQSSYAQDVVDQILSQLFSL